MSPSPPTAALPSALGGNAQEPPSLELIRAAATEASLTLGLEEAPGQSARAFRSLPRTAFLPQKMSKAERERLVENNPVFFSLFSGGLAELEAALAKDPDGARRALLGDEPEKSGLQLNYTALHVAAQRDDAQAATRLIRAGAEPTRFIAGVSSVGLSAYVGSHNALKAMLEAGADARLTLKPEHSLGSSGSTLLHRVLEREGRNRVWVVQTLILSGQYPDPLPLTDAGVSPLDYAEDGHDLAVHWLRSYIAALEGQAINRGLPERFAPDSRGPRLL